LNYSQRTVRYVTLDAADVGEVPTPDDKTLEAFYEKVAENYAAPEYRTVEYAVIRQQDVLRNVDINEDDVKILYQQNKDNYLQPERREVEQLIFPDKKQAKEARDAIEGGMELAEAASSFGARNQDSIRLGRVKKEDVFEAAQEKIFSLAEGEVSDTIETAFGWHLFRVTKIIPAGYAPLEEVRERIEADLRQQRADEQMYEITTKIEDNLAGGASLKEIAEQNGLKIKISEPFTASGKKENGESVSGIVSQPQFLTKAFELKEGETSPLLRAGSDQHYLLSVQKITPKRIKALDEVRGLVVSAWQAQEAKKQLKQKAEQSVQQLNQGGTLENVSESLQKPVITSDLFSLKDKPVNLPEMLTESAFHQPVGSTLPLAEQGGIYYLAVVNEEKKAPSEKEDSKFYQEKIKAMEDSLQASYREELLQSYYHHLKMIHPVSINADVLKKALN
jgi:peptidyl-prolyl cis-trans isomerase D